MITKQTRIPYRLPGSGPYLATVVNHLDPTYMGSIEVSIIKGYTNDPTVKNQTFVVQYLSPFYGVTRQGAKNRPNFKDFKETQTSYGMWMIPPDIGTTVICFFVEGDTQNGFWIGCVQEDYQNFMIPGIAAAEYPETELTDQEKNKYGTNYLPSAEFNKYAPPGSYNANINNPDKKLRPIHPFADRLIEQGLLLDKVRGVTSSSARREVPSAVFGISTPGPLENPAAAIRDYVGAEDRQTSIIVNRKGGSSFVMDDGDINGENELVRIRTRTGHQILLHNTADLIYIANSKGTAWIELTSQGKIDIFAQDSVSIHTEADFNFRADRDVNIEAGRYLRMASAGGMDLKVGGNRNIEIIGDDLISVAGNFNLTSKNIKMKADDDYHLISDNVFQTASLNFHIKSEKNNYFQSGLQTNILSGGPTKILGSSLSLVGSPPDPASAATAPSIPLTIKTKVLPSTKSSEGWENRNFYNSADIVSIMNRVPMHEPWDQHENLDPIRFSTGSTSMYPSSNTQNSNPDITPNTDQPSDWKEDKEFIAEVKRVASVIGVDYVDLFTAMYFETGGKLDANTPCRNGSAIGLIQFTAPAIKQINEKANPPVTITREYLGSLTRTQQMKWVEAYFKYNSPWQKNKTSRSFEDLYMALLYPEAVGKPNNYVLFVGRPDFYNANAGLDIDRDGSITKLEAASRPKSFRSKVGKILNSL